LRVYLPTSELGECRKNVFDGHGGFRVCLGEKEGVINIHKVRDGSGPIHHITVVLSLTVCPLLMIELMICCAG